MDPHPTTYKTHFFPGQGLKNKPPTYLGGAPLLLYIPKPSQTIWYKNYLFVKILNSNLLKYIFSRPIRLTDNN